MNGAYGPHTCVQGYVWREAYAGDDVCVTGAQRSQAAAGNAQAHYAGAMAYTLLQDEKQGRRYLLRALDLKPEWRTSARQDALLQTYFA